MLKKKEEKLDLTLLEKHIKEAKDNPLKSGTKSRGNRKAVASSNLNEFLSNLSAGALAKNTEYWNSLTVQNHFQSFQVFR